MMCVAYGFFRKTERCFAVIACMFPEPTPFVMLRIMPYAPF